MQTARSFTLTMFIRVLIQMLTNDDKKKEVAVRLLWGQCRRSPINEEKGVSNPFTED